VDSKQLTLSQDAEFVPSGLAVRVFSDHCLQLKPLCFASTSICCQKSASKLMVVLLGLLMCRSWFSILLNSVLVFGFLSTVFVTYSQLVASEKMPLLSFNS
jgi:hypothetical protein